MGQILCACIKYECNMQSYGSPQSSVLSSLSSFRSRPYTSVGVTYSPTPDVNEVYPGLFVGDA